MTRFLFVIAIIALLGCGASGPQLAQVRGKISYKKAPVKFGTVMFQPENGKVASGTIQPDGSYELSTIKPGDGAVVGKHRISVTSTSTQDPNFKLAAGQEMPAGRFLTPEQYSVLDGTPLKNYEVKAGQENVIDIDLVD